MKVLVGLLLPFVIVSGMAIAQPVVTLNPSVRYQTIQGFGGALAFGEQSFNTLPSANFNHLIWRLFDDLRMNIVRVRMRNEIEPVNDNGNPDSINWSNVRALPDTAVIRIVRAGRALGYGVNVLATPWSPPSWMKTNDTTINGGHLRPGMEAELAEWLRIFLLVWQNQYGLPIQMLSVQNEPSWVATYESCIYTPAELNRALRVVVPKLRSWGFDSLKILAPDDASAEASLTFTDSLLLVPNVRSLLSGFAVHNYSTPYNNPAARITQLQSIEQQCSAVGVPVWLTEYGNLNNYGAGTLTEAHLEAWHWFVALNDLGSSTYLHWQLAATKRSADPPLGAALVQYNTDNSTFYIPKKYYFVKQFTRFVTPGMMRVDISGFPAGVRGSAFVDAAQGNALSIIQNSTPTSQALRLAWPGADTLQVWRSSRMDTCSQIPSLVKSGNYFELTLPDSSIVTLLGNVQATSVGDEAREPTTFALFQNYPNPFNPTTTIKFSVGSASGRTGELVRVTLKVYDVLGREVVTLVDEPKHPGAYTVTWDASTVPSGVYFVRLTAGSFSQTRKAVVMK
jgi:O-glycosyl hydrolase